MKTKLTFDALIILGRNAVIAALIVVFIGSCNSSQVGIIQPELLGKWAGNTRFFGVDFEKELGPLPFELTLGKNGEVKGRIGEAHFSEGKIEKAKFGYLIQVKLDQKIKSDTQCKKQKLEILLVMPIQTNDSKAVLDTDIHLLSNFHFDLSMQVGNVQLRKLE
jgi:hypothetical protein